MAQPAIAEKRPRKHVYQADTLAEPPPPKVAEIIQRHAGKRDALITVLQEIQAAFGYLPERPLRYVARGLGIPLSRIYGVATFYNQFRFDSPGKYVVRTCRGTACHVSHSPLILAALKEHLGVGEDQTTSDGVFTLQTVACMGCCSLAPVIAVNDTTFGRMTPESAIETLEKIRSGQLEVEA